SDAFFGTLAFQDGKVIAASTSRGNKGPEASYDLVAARRGSFEFRPEIPAGIPFEMLLSVENVLLEAMRRRDELQQLELSITPPTPEAPTSLRDPDLTETQHDRNDEEP